MSLSVRHPRIAAAIATAALAGGLSLATGTTSAGNVAWGVSVGGPGYAVTAGAPAHGGYLGGYLGGHLYGGYPYYRRGYHGRPYVPVAGLYYRPYYPVVAAPPVVYPAPVVYPPYYYAPPRVVVGAGWRGY